MYFAEFDPSYENMAGKLYYETENGLQSQDIIISFLDYSINLDENTKVIYNKLTSLIYGISDEYRYYLEYLRRFFGVDFDFTDALAVNKQAEGEYYRMMLTNGIMSVNEIRGKIGLPKISAEEGGDDHFIQISYGTMKNVASGAYMKDNSQDQGQKIDNKVKALDK